MIRGLMAGSYQRAGGRSFRWSLLSPSRGTEQGVFRRTYVRGSIPIDKASLRASRSKTTSLFLQLSLSVCLSFTNPVLVHLHLHFVGMKPKPSRMVSTSWRNSSLSNWRYCTFPRSVQCSTSSPRNMSIAWMSSFTSRCRSRVKWMHCAGVPRHKIRAESSSNGSELRSAGLTPHKIRAELSSNGSSRPASDKKSELRAHQMAHAG